MRRIFLFGMTCVLTLILNLNTRSEEINSLPVPDEKVDMAGDGSSAWQLGDDINQLESVVEASNKDLEIALLADKKEQEAAQANFWALLTATIALISLIIIYAVVRNQKRRRQTVEAEKRLKEFELQETKTKLHQNVKLMDSFTQRILEKNKVIAELEKKIRSNPLFNQSTENARKRLQAVSEMRILTSDDWEKFQSNVNKVYPGLINQVCDSFPLITDAELRMFLLIKLSVKNKDVSEILGISPDSVRKTRFRLKKKLSLREEDDLVDFIMDYNGSISIAPDEKQNP